MKLKPPSWQTIRAMHLIAAMLAFGAAAWAGPSWLATVYGVMGGFNLGLAVSITWQIRTQKAFDRVVEAFNAIAHLNEELIGGKVRIMLMEQREDDSPPLPTRLH